MTNPPEIQAVTFYGTPIPKALTDRKSAFQWAEENVSTYPGCRIVQKTKTGFRTIWKDEAKAERVAA